MKTLILSLAIGLFAGSVFAGPTPEQPDRNSKLYSLVDGNVGLKGYDPVSYFAEGGNKPLLGLKNITGEYGGVIYRFHTEENKELFFENPTKYEPTYGGWCAWAMANQSYAEIDPKQYTFTQVIDGNTQQVTSGEGARIHFFISRGAKARFDRDLTRHEPNADSFWQSESGESPRN